MRRLPGFRTGKLRAVAVGSEPMVTFVASSERPLTPIRLQLEQGGGCNAIIRRDLGVDGLSSTPTRFRQVQCFQAVLETELQSTSLTPLSLDFAGWRSEATRSASPMMCA